MDIRKYIEHTIVKAEAGRADIIKFCDEAKTYQFYGVCVNPAWVKLAKQELVDSGIAVVAVCGFPLGATFSNQKSEEARESIRAGADEIDMVMNIGFAKSGLWEELYADILAVREATRGKILKVILETGLLSDEEKERACVECVRAGVDFVKTSTTFAPVGVQLLGANVSDILLMKKAVQGKARIKASGGIRTYADAIAMINAGASRIGASRSIAIVTDPANS